MKWMPEIPDAKEMASNPAGIWLAILLMGGVGVGKDFIPQSEGSQAVTLETHQQFVTSTNAALGDIRTAMVEMENKRDEEVEIDHLWVRCARGALDCSSFKAPNDDEDND